MTIASVCTGGMLVAAAGLLAGRPAVTHHAALEDLAAAGAQVVDARVVDDGDIVSAGGVTSGIDLALHIVERELGAETAAAVAREMEHDRRGPVHLGPARGLTASRNFRCGHVTRTRRWGILSLWLALSGAGRSRSAS